ncbi:MAG: hypothetical protein ACMVY4_06920 [Minwuia sp.]|uniref:hypothetical protein n=1 Tax=Minwuia sp. TaxID=2493630 RepID=UPI003A8B4D3E
MYLTTNRRKRISNIRRRRRDRDLSANASLTLTSALIGVLSAHGQVERELLLEVLETAELVHADLAEVDALPRFDRRVHARTAGIFRQLARQHRAH